MIVLRCDIDAVEQFTQALVHGGFVRAVVVVAPLDQLVVQHLGVGFGDEDVGEGLAHSGQHCHPVEAHGADEAAWCHDGFLHIGVLTS